MKKVLTTIAISVGIVLGAFLIILSTFMLSGLIAFHPEFSFKAEKNFSLPIIIGLIGVVLMILMSFLGIRKRPFVTSILFVIIGCFMLFWQFDRIVFLGIDINTATPETLSFIASQRSRVVSAYPDIYPELVNEYKRFFLGYAIPTALLGAGLLTGGIFGVI